MGMKFWRILTLVFACNIVLAPLAHAGFGITPPYVRNTSLTRNSIYEQQILMVRSDPTVPLEATITVDAPEIEDWIEILEGVPIPLPTGEQKVPMTVRVTVPDDAEFQRYTGKIRIKTGPPDNAVTAGAVNIALGAQVDIDINIIDREIFDFRVKRISAPDLNEGHKVGWLFFPGKIQFGISLENTGNVNVAPSKVTFDIYDNSGTVLLEETQHTNRISKIAPFASEEVTAELPTRLPAGTYLARYAIYNQDEIKQEGELTLSVLPYGTLQIAGYGFMGLSIPHKISIVLPILTLLILVFVVVRNRRQRHS